jgi:hypothetical protein
MTAAVAIIIRREKDAVAAFKAAGATSADRASTPEALGVRHDVALRRLTSRAVLRPGKQPGTLYLDEPSWVALRGMRQRMAVVMIVVAICVGVAAWYASVHAASR